MSTIQEDRYRAAGLKALRHVALFSSLSAVFERFVPTTDLVKLETSVYLGYWPRIRNPRTFNEKILHRMLHTDERRFARLADKYAVREYVRDRAGDGVLNDVLCVTDDPDEIPFEELPDRFVVKATHGSGMAHLVDDADAADFDDIRARCREWLTQPATETHEYWYRDIEPRILVERYLRDDEYGVPLDFKFHVFHGQVEYVEVHFDRFEDYSIRIFDADWEPLEVTQGDPPLGPVIEPPELLDEMVDTANRLGADFDYVRVDLYQPNGEEVVFGELTFAPAAGWLGFDPVSFDFELGSYW